MSRDWLSRTFLYAFGVKLDPNSFLTRQLHSAAVSTKGRIVVSGIVTIIARFLGVEPNPKDRVSGSEWLD